MAILRQYIAPFLALLIFTFALVAVSARIFLPSDMAAPAPIGMIIDWGRSDFIPFPQSEILNFKF